VQALELSKDAKERLAELEELSAKAECGDKAARAELRKAVRESSPEIVREASDIARRGQWGLIKTAAAGELLVEEALVARLDLMRREIGGPDPSPLEVLLTERVVSCWILLELLELLTSAQLVPPGKNQRLLPHSLLKFYLGWQEKANRQFLSAIRELAKVRRLQTGVPNSNTNNVQINLG
jgi:hypothetical protein